MSSPKKDDGVHTSHCCHAHGCKYGDPDCPVALGTLQQEYPCEDCGDEIQEDRIMDNLKIAREVQEQAIDRMAVTQPRLLDEQQAHKRACLRMGYEMALAIVAGEEVAVGDLKKMERDDG